MDMDKQAKFGTPVAHPWAGRDVAAERPQTRTSGPVLGAEITSERCEVEQIDYTAAVVIHCRVVTGLAL